LPKHLIAETNGIDRDRMLEQWRWLVPVGAEPLFATVLGDLFLRAPDGRVVWLDVGAGTATDVASDESEFSTLLDDEEHVQEWFMPQLVTALMASGSALAPGQCYSFKILPTLGGTYDPDNCHTLDLLSHFTGMGKLQRQIVALPLGTEIRVATLEGTDT